MPWVVGMNWDKWDSLPKDIQKEIEKLSGSYGAEMFANAWDADDIACYNKLGEDPDRERILLSAAEVDRGREIEKPFYDKWVADMAAKGADGRAILDEMMRLSEMYSKKFPK